MNGADVTTPVSAEQWKTLRNQNAVTFGIVRCYHAGGDVDPSAAATVNQGWAAGLSSVDVYHSPCLSIDAEAQVQAAVWALSAAHARFEHYWIEVEHIGWTSSCEANAAYLTRLIQAAEARGLKVGICTSAYEWGATINSSAFSKYGLWYVHYDGMPSFADFKRFGGWETPTMKQFEDNHTTDGFGFNGNWAPRLH